MRYRSESGLLLPYRAWRELGRPQRWRRQQRRGEGWRRSWWTSGMWCSATGMADGCARNAGLGCRSHCEATGLAMGLVPPLRGGRPAATAVVRFGRVQLDRSHDLVWQGKGWKCEACGGAATHWARTLAQPCRLHVFEGGSAAGRRNDSPPQASAPPVQAAVAEEPTPCCSSAWNLLRERVRIRLQGPAERQHHL